MRVKSLRITLPLRFFQNNQVPRVVQVVANPLPDDAEIVRVGYDAISGSAYFIIQSASYEDVPEGDAIPAADVPLFADAGRYVAPDDAVKLEAAYQQVLRDHLPKDADTLIGQVQAAVLQLNKTT